MSRFVFIAALVCAAPASAQTAFFAQIEDLPIPPGYTERAGAVVFDTERGRLVMVSATGPGASALAVRDFYHETLPRLGWAVSAEEGAVVFQRGRERLLFFVERDGALMEMRVQLIVRPASMNAD